MQTEVKKKGCTSFQNIVIDYIGVNSYRPITFVLGNTSDKQYHLLRISTVENCMGVNLFLKT